MTDFLTATMSEVVKSILEDSKIDDDEVVALRKRIYADAVIDSEEADALFTINDAVKGNDNSKNWTTLFADAIGDYLLKDEKSPGVVDDDEAAWLIEKLEGDGEIDANERFLLKSLKEKATSLPQVLRDKLKAWGV